MTQQAEITCVNCGKKDHHLRRGSIESEEAFRKRGWAVLGRNGTNASDICPECLKNNDKTAEEAESHFGALDLMKEQMRPDTAIPAGAIVADAIAPPLAPAPAPAETIPMPRRASEDRKITGVDRVLIGAAIADQFTDEGVYKPKWNDAALAQQLNVPTDWVKTEREHLFPGSVSESPEVGQIVEIIATIDKLLNDFEALSKELKETVTKADLQLKQVMESQREARLFANRVHEKQDEIVKLRDQCVRIITIVTAS